VILPTKMSPGFTSAPNANDTVRAEIFERSSPRFGCPVIFLGPSLCPPRVTSNSVNVNARENVVLHDALTDENRVLEVIAIPRMKETSTLRRARVRVARARPSAMTALFHMSPLLTKFSD